MKKQIVTGIDKANLQEISFAEFLSKHLITNQSHRPKSLEDLVETTKYRDTREFILEYFRMLFADSRNLRSSICTACLRRSVPMVFSRKRCFTISSQLSSLGERSLIKVSCYLNSTNRKVFKVFKIFKNSKNQQPLGCLKVIIPF